MKLESEGTEKDLATKIFGIMECTPGLIFKETVTINQSKIVLLRKEKQ